MSIPIFTSKRLHRNQYRPSRKASLVVSTLIYLPLLLCGWIWIVLLTQGYFTIAGVPFPIIANFLQDETARNAYFEGDNTKLHNRLQEMGVEEQIKAFYRHQIEDETKLDQYIHQLLYERTGYVGLDYTLDSKGILVLKQRK